MKIQDRLIMQIKYLVQIEFRHHQIPPSEDFGSSTSTMLTVGVYKNEQEAYNAGNKVMEVLEARYPLHVFPDGSKAVKKRFSKNGGAFGYPNRLITKSAYLKTPFDFYAQVTPLVHAGLEGVLNQVEDSVKEYRDYQKENQ